MRVACRKAGLQKLGQGLRSNLRVQQWGPVWCPRGQALPHTSADTSAGAHSLVGLGREQQVPRESMWTGNSSPTAIGNGSCHAPGSLLGKQEGRRALAGGENDSDWELNFEI